MASLTLSFDAADFGSEDQITDFFNSIAAAVKAVAKLVVTTDKPRKIAKTVEPAVKLAPEVPAAEEEQHPAPEATGEAHVEPEKKARKPRATKAAAVEAAPEVQPEAAASEPLSFDVFRARVNSQLSKGKAQLVGDTMKAVGCTKFAEVPEHYRLPFVLHLEADGKTDFALALEAADLAVR